jgi:acetyltransferase EpsM
VLDKKAIAIIGYSGHAFVVAEILIEQGFTLDFYIDKKELTHNPYGLKYLGCETDHDFQGWELNFSYVLGIGNNRLREKTAQIVVDHDKPLRKVISNSSSISKTAYIGNGVFVSRGVLVNALAQIEDYAILNTGCIIEHECIINCAAHIGPGAVLAGNVSIGRRTFVGANSVIKQGIKIGEDVVIGAGSVIINDVPNNSKMVGNPARMI